MAPVESGPLDVMAARAAERLATDPAAAERDARAVLAIAPADPRAALILGSARRRQGDPRTARAILEPLARAWPRAANTHYELGATLAALGETAPALVALRHGAPTAQAFSPDAACSAEADFASVFPPLRERPFQSGRPL